ncbi:hypothetical protein GAV44_23295 [Salmonella enterica subsp. enterica serovar Newport]|nr:hypothetical protein [Salmonella enterica subsp. enterica serovar Newport]
MKRYHVISISVLLGLIAGLSVSKAQADTNPAAVKSTFLIACSERKADADQAKGRLFVVDVFANNDGRAQELKPLANGNFEPQKLYFKGQTMTEKGYHILPYTTRQDLSVNAADGVIFYLPETPRADHLITALKTHTDNAGKVHNKAEYICTIQEQ